MNFDKREVLDHWEKFLNPESLKRNLIACSVYLTAYEMLRAALIDTLRGFYCDDYSQFPKYPISEKYKNQVRSLHKSEMTACAIWFFNSGALTEDDLLLLDDLRIHRNEIAHQIQEVVASSRDVSLLHLKCIYALTSKVDQWWIRNVEVPINPDLSDREMSEEEWEQAYSMRMMMMFFMVEIAEGDDSRMSSLYESWKADPRIQAMRCRASSEELNSGKNAK